MENRNQDILQNVSFCVPQKSVKSLQRANNDRTYYLEYNRKNVILRPTKGLKRMDEKKIPIVIHYHVEGSAGRTIWRLISGKRTEKPEENATAASVQPQTENK